MDTEQVKEPETVKEQEQPKKQKTSDEIRKLSEQLRQVQEERENIAAQLETERTEKLKEQQQYKQLWEQEKKRKEEAEQNVQKLKTTFSNTLKRSAVHKEAMSQGIRPEALKHLDMLDYESIVLETTSNGAINILGAKEYVEGLKNGEESYWFKSNAGPNVNTKSPSDEVKAKNMSIDEVLKLEKSDPQAYQKWIMDRVNSRKK
jgi:hypothetical protein